jgi:hypothetical protein
MAIISGKQFINQDGVKMKSLSNYVEAEQSKIFDDLGVFFAFSKSQMEAGCEKVGATVDNKVTSFGGGGYVLSKNLDKFLEEMERINTKGIEQDIQENGLINIIQRELANYEVQLTGDWMQLLEVLEDYPGVTEELIKKQYRIFIKNNSDY